MGEQINAKLALVTAAAIVTLAGHMTRVRTLAMFWLLSGLLVGCDAWPTAVDNRAANDIQFRYLHKSYDRWSAPFPLGPNEAVVLDRAHYADEIVGIQVTESGKRYLLGKQGFAVLHRICARTWVDKLATLGNCYLAYVGEGRFVFSDKWPKDIDARSSLNAAH